MDKTINKPISIVRQEFIDKLIHEVNECQLPLFVIEPILQDLLNVVKTSAQKQYENDKIQYEKQLSELAKKEND